MTIGRKRSSRLVAAAIALFVAWQLLMPAALLFANRPAPFGWQMYSALPDLPRAWVLDAEGRESPVDLRTLFAETRAEIDYAAALRAGLCNLPAVVAVKVQEPERPSPELIECP